MSMVTRPLARPFPSPALPKPSAQHPRASRTPGPCLRHVASAGTAAVARAVLLAFALAGAATMPARAADEAMVDFKVLRQDTLIGLSRSMLTAPDAWREVARINRLRNPDRLAPGQVLRIPARLLRTQAVPATLVAVSGEVRAAAQPASAGMTLREGDAVQTGADGSAVIELADRTRVQLPPSSLAELAASRRAAGREGATPQAAAADAANESLFAGTLRLLRGSAEVFASKVLRLKPLEVVTPTAVIGVRGTHYRVGFDEEANRSTHSEVVEGRVRFERADRGAGTALERGYGAQVDATAAAPVAVKMLDAPDLSGVPARFERPLVRLKRPEGSGTARVQVAADAGFDTLVSDQRVAAGAEIRIAGLPDGQWHLRVRRVDEHGIEGFDARTAFVLKARPEPPLPGAPRSDAKQPAGSVEFAWASNAAAPRARLQVARDAQFARIVLDRDDLAEPRVQAQIAEPGSYFWRLASIRPDGDHGPFGDAQRFELRALPEPPSGGVAPGGKALSFQWSGRPGDRQQAELARDPQFRDVVAREELDAPKWEPAISGGGRYYFRYRSIEPDGYVGPYTEPLTVEVPRDWSPLLLLVPLLLAL